MDNTPFKRRSNYTFSESVKNVFSLIKTRIFFPKARLIRFPIIVRGKKYIDFGSNLTTGYHCRFEANGQHDDKILVFGNNVNVGDNVRISAVSSVKIGSNVLMGSRVLIIDNSHGSYSGDHQDDPDTPPDARELKFSPVVIEDNVWIGENAVIQMGVTVGHGSIINAGCVVTKDIEPECIAAGVPARIIKRYDHNSSQWRKI